MRWQLYLDDVRFPPKDDPDFRLARSVDDAMWMIRSYGLPYSMSLDHDLGNDRMSGMDFIKQFCGYLMDSNQQIPADFWLIIHSANPVGAANMQSYWDCFIDHHAI